MWTAALREKDSSELGQRNRAITSVSTISKVSAISVKTDALFRLTSLNRARLNPHLLDRARRCVARLGDDGVFDGLSSWIR